MLRLQDSHQHCWALTWFPSRLVEQVHGKTSAIENGVNLVQSFLLVRYANRADLMWTSQSSLFSFTNFTRAVVSVWFNRSSKPFGRSTQLKQFLIDFVTNSRPWLDITITATSYLVMRWNWKSATPRSKKMIEWVTLAIDFFQQFKLVSDSNWLLHCCSTLFDT